MSLSAKKRSKGGMQKCRLVGSSREELLKELSTASEKLKMVEQDESCSEWTDFAKDLVKVMKHKEKVFY